MTVQWDNVDLSFPVNSQCGLNRGLVAWWLGLPRLAGGVTWRDIVRHSHATLTSMAPKTDWIAKGNQSQVLQFPAPTDNAYLSVPSATLASATGTVMLWAKRDWVAAGWHYLWDTAGDRFLLLSNNSTTEWLLYTAGASRGVVTYPWPTTAFHVAVSWPSNDFYVNGQYVDTWNDGAVSGAGIMHVGRLASSGSNNWQGWIGDIAIFDRELSARDHETRYEDSLAGYPLALNRPQRVFPAVAAAPGGLSIPIAMHHYKQMMGAN